MVNVTRTFKNLDHPLDKIFGGIPAGSSLPAVDGVFHPRFGEALRKRNDFRSIYEYFLVWKKWPNMAADVKIPRAHWFVPTDTYGIGRSTDIIVITRFSEPPLTAQQSSRHFHPIEHRSPGAAPIHQPPRARSYLPCGRIASRVEV